jgi:hypothetical protein
MSESHLSVTFIAARTVRSCQSALIRAMFIGAGIVRAMFIRAGIVRDLVRDHVKAALVRATLVRATFIRAGIVRDYVRAHFYSRDYQGLCQSHINQTPIVRDHIRAAHATVER